MHQIVVSVVLQAQFYFIEKKNNFKNDTFYIA